tara:strand:+ start:848 stop:1594 length:747 start_codon:yes stop_codon:yes gene_type:complete
MTTTEFSNEFDLLYDNASKGAPGIDMYEKSVYLTTAQEELVKEIYSGYTPSRIGFEGSEKRRKQLSNLLKDAKISRQVSDSEALITTSQFFGLPSNLLYIVLESVTLIEDSEKPGYPVNQIPVKPVTHDEFLVNIRNPFKKPNDKKAWRMDVGRSGAVERVELFAVRTIATYQLRYIKNPDPIILTSFEDDSELAGLGLSVNGVNTVTECELEEQMHRDILNKAVEIAILRSRENSLVNIVNTNKKIV